MYLDSLFSERGNINLLSGSVALVNRRCINLSDLCFLCKTWEGGQVVDRTKGIQTNIWLNSFASAGAQLAGSDRLPHHV